jgi:hypothetical protein
MKARPGSPQPSVSDGPPIASNRGPVQRVANVRFCKVRDRMAAEGGLPAGLTVYPTAYDM